MLQAVHGWSSTYERFVKSQKFFSSYLTQEDLPEFGRKTPLKRAGQPVELSGLYVFLASQESSFITAEVFGVTGGMHLA